MSEDRREGEQRARWLLAIGVLAGIGLTAASLLGSGRPPQVSSADAVALVNGQPIAREAFDRMLSLTVPEGVEPDPDRARELLQRLIDEELLLQRGLELGLARYEPGARRAVVGSLIASITAEAEGLVPEESELMRFYEDERQRFVRPHVVELDLIFVAAEPGTEVEAFRRSREAAERLRSGVDPASLQSELGDAAPREVPAGSVALATLRERFGPMVARNAERMELDTVSEPIRIPEGFVVIRPRERGAPAPAPFEEVRRDVRALYLRSRTERALADYVADLRADADVEILE